MAELKAKKVVVFLPSEASAEALVLSSENGPVTVDEAMPAGATVR